MNEIHRQLDDKFLTTINKFPNYATYSDNTYMIVIPQLDMFALYYLIGIYIKITGLHCIQGLLCKFLTDIKNCCQDGE